MLSDFLTGRELSRIDHSEVQTKDFAIRYKMRHACMEGFLMRFRPNQAEKVESSDYTAYTGKKSRIPEAEFRSKPGLLGGRR